MKTREKKELQTKSVEELRKLLADARAERNRASLMLAQFKAKNTREVFLKRKEIAQILTVLNMKEKSADTEGMADKGGEK